MKKILFPVLILLGCASCSNYYQAITAPEPAKSATFNDFQDNRKYYILHNGSEAFAMKNISASSDRKNLQCTLETLPAEHQLYLKNGNDGKRKYKKSNNTDEDETGVLNEVHIYMTPGSKTDPGAYTLAMENVQKAEIIEKDKIKTRKSHAMGTAILVSASVIVVGGIIALALSASLAAGF